MVFADDERKSNPTGFAFLQAAHLWKQRQAAAAAQSGSGGGDSAVDSLLAAAQHDAVVENRDIQESESSDDEMEDGIETNGNGVVGSRENSDEESDS